MKLPLRCLLLLVALTAALSKESINTGVRADEARCHETWKLVYENDPNGHSISGNRYALLAAILAGSRVRVRMGDYVTEADGVYASGCHAQAELLQHVSKATWQTFQKNAYWFWTMVSSSGFSQYTRYYVGTNRHAGTNNAKVATKWYVKPFKPMSQPTYATTRNGKAIVGTLHTLQDAVRSGCEIRAVTDKSYGFTLQNIEFNKGVVAGQFLDHVSKGGTAQQLTFQNNAYWWFTIISTSGKRDMSRWTVGKHVSRGHTNDKVTNDWFVDPCWKLVYTHDRSGGVIQGALGALVSAVRSGQRVRFQLPAWRYATEADNLSIRKGHVTAQALKHVSHSMETFHSDAYWYWLMVSTTGTVRASRYSVGSNVNRGSSKHHITIKWFVDTRPWTLALAHDKAGHEILGNRHDLIRDIRRGASVRIVNMDGAYAFVAQNLQVHSDHVGAQTLNSVSMRGSPQSSYEMEITPNPYWWFTTVSTRGMRDMSRWTVGEHVSRGHSQDRVSMKWFVQK